MPPVVSRPDAAPAVDLADHPLEVGLIRLAVLGADGFALDFHDPAIVEAARSCLAPPGAPDGGPFDAEALRPYAGRGLAALEAAAPHDDRLGRLLALWRPAALALAGRADERTAEEAHRERLAGRLAELEAAIAAANAAGDGDRAQALHARYIELGTAYAGRLARLWGG